MDLSRGTVEGSAQVVVRVGMAAGKAGAAVTQHRCNHSDRYAGYILLDLDQPAPGILSSLRALGHDPSVLVETSPRRLQAWIHVSQAPLSPSLATCISRKLAQFCAADRASADWRHVGRLAAFTNRKPQRCEPDGLAPWVRLIYARNCLAPAGAALIENAVTELATGSPALDRPALQHTPGLASNGAADSTVLRTLYQGCLTRLRILERYPLLVAPSEGAIMAAP